MKKKIARKKKKFIDLKDDRFGIALMYRTSFLTINYSH